jgi:hypothetical protein
MWSECTSEDSSVATNLVNEILQKLSSQILTSKAKRLSKLENRPRPILVQFNSSTEVHSILRIKSKIHNSVHWKNVLISMDMTEI